MCAIVQSQGSSTPNGKIQPNQLDQVSKDSVEAFAYIYYS